MSLSGGLRVCLWLSEWVYLGLKDGAMGVLSTESKNMWKGFIKKMQQILIRGVFAKLKLLLRM